MKVVWVVLFNDCEGRIGSNWVIVKIFSEREDANAYIKKRPKLARWLQIEGHEVIDKITSKNKASKA